MKEVKYKVKEDEFRRIIVSYTNEEDGKDYSVVTTIGEYEGCKADAIKRACEILGIKYVGKGKSKKEE